METERMKFTGHFGEYFVFSLGLLILSICTLGILFPYWFYWNFKYFFTKMEVENSGRIKFTGHFGEYFVFSLGLLILSICTLGLLLPYYMYWSLKYFFTRMEIEYFASRNNNQNQGGGQTIIRMG